MRTITLGLATLAWVAIAASCLSATPPKTPNQRAVERAAPRVEPPAPPDAGRYPRPERSPRAGRP